ncbi:hypothetical protein SY88_06675 [Clostridiales bacterium PH28_bin88]|nr:hypothetical protein SY88_06675 [Clostridiales bacterium PH28_bin88]
MKHVLRRLWAEEDGQALTEYGLILALVAVLVIGTLLLLKDELITLFGKVITGLQGQQPAS